jgi:two-component system sensor histidine kinase MprB
MSYRLRLSIVATLAVAFATIAASIAVFVSFRSTLYQRVDESLQGQARFVQAMARRDDVLPTPRGAPGAAVSIMQVVDEDGEIDSSRISSAGTRGPGPGPNGDRRRPAPPPPEGDRFGFGVVSRSVELKVTDSTKDVLKGDDRSTFETQTVDGIHMRVLTVRLKDGAAAQLGRSVEEIQSSLSHARRQLIGIVIASILLAAVLGWYLMRMASTPVQRLEHLARDVAAQQDLSLRISETGNDEIGRLANQFNLMLDALAEARRLQQQLVEDASHELRTPLTSMKTNLEVLAMAKELTPDHRELLSDVNVQIDELGDLVANLVELAHGNAPSGEREPVDLADIVRACVSRAERHAGGRVTFDTDISSCTATVDRDRVQSAIDNLLSNAIKFSPDQGTVTVTLDASGQITVSDQGHGVDEDDRNHVFDRFYRSVAARGKPGAGLGLAIARAAAEEHGGTIAVDSVPDGTGARFTLTIPPA